MTGEAVTTSKLTDPTAREAYHSMRGYYRRLKEIWEDNRLDLEKAQKKIDKAMEAKFYLEEYRQELEAEINALKENFARYCEETNLPYTLEGQD